MTAPMLYTFRRCPYAMRARMALLQSSVRFQAYELVLSDKPAEMLLKSPKGTVPVLVLGGDHVIDESWLIMEWAFANHDEGLWWARAQSQENLGLLALNDGVFKEKLDRYKYANRYLGVSPSDEREQACDLFLRPLELRLQDQAMLGGAVPCATDLAIFPFVRQFAAVDSDWFSKQQLPAVQKWLAVWTGSELFARCMLRLPVRTWQWFDA